MKPEFKAGSNNYLAFLFFEPSDILPMPKPLGGGIVNRNSKFPLLPSVQEIGNARVKGDIERVFNDASVFEDLAADYKYRAFINRQIVQAEISKQVEGIDYYNFKGSISKEEQERHDAYMRVWSALHRIQK